MKITPTQNVSGTIEYQSHIQGIGWENAWKKNGEISGTAGQGRRIEALKIKLSGELAEKYDVYYRVHSQFFGWMNWAKNGEATGTEGFSYRLEAYQVQLVPKGQTAPSGQGRKFAKFQNAVVTYQTHVQKKGWMPQVINNQTSGTVGSALRIEALKLKISSNPLSFSGNLEYQTHNQGIGWQKWMNNYGLSGTEGQGLRTEAIRIRFSGELATHYNVYYRVHCQSYGWMNWVKNGEVAGTIGKAKRMEAIQIVVVGRNGRGPG